ncbi:MAG: hypothetical protein ACI80V_001903 [Rhodothermales bacterium]|jgi:hypothetical protein
MSNQQAPAPNQQINIELSEEVAEGVYANLVMIAHSSEEFVMDFIRVMPGVPKARVKSRIIVTPAHAKRLLRALAENLERYERAHGEIAEAGFPGPAIQFAGPSGEA